MGLYRSTVLFIAVVPVGLMASCKLPRWHVASGDCRSLRALAGHRTNSKLSDLSCSGVRIASVAQCPVFYWLGVIGTIPSHLDSHTIQKCFVLPTCFVSITRCTQFLKLVLDLGLRVCTSRAFRLLSLVCFRSSSQVINGSCTLDMQGVDPGASTPATDRGADSSHCTALATHVFPSTQ